MTSPWFPALPFSVPKHSDTPSPLYYPRSVILQRQTRALTTPQFKDPGAVRWHVSQREAISVRVAELNARAAPL